MMMAVLWAELWIALLGSETVEKLVEKTVAMMVGRMVEWWAASSVGSMDDVKAEMKVETKESLLDTMTAQQMAVCWAVGLDGMTARITVEALVA